MEKTLSSGSTSSSVSFVRLIAGAYNWLTKNIPVSYLLILLFGYTAFSKMEFFSKGKFLDVGSFQYALFLTPILRRYVFELSYIVPFANLAVCILLAIRKTKLIGYYAALLLLCVFTAYIIYTIVVLPILPAATGGVISTLSWNNHLILNLCFILFTAHAIYLAHKRS